MVMIVRFVLCYIDKFRMKWTIYYKAANLKGSELHSKATHMFLSIRASVLKEENVNLVSLNDQRVCAIMI